ncbi:MAG: hypothetical protein HYZ53_25235 [Planctomycetes bacterium]|nr:hypothetical protein [Planctomycetota bacterium]
MISVRLLPSAAGLALVLALVGAPHCRGQEPAATQYVFFLDGKEFVPQVHSLRGTPEEPHEGDVVEIAGPQVVLGPPGVYRYRSVKEDGSWRALLLEQPGGAPRLVWALLYEQRPPSGEGDLLAVNPLAGLSSEELRAIRGVALCALRDEFRPWLARLELARVCVEVDGHDLDYAALPGSLAYLEIRSSSLARFADFVSRSDALRFLKLTNVWDQDPKLLSKLHHLRYLHLVGLPGETKFDPSPLAHLVELRDLDLRRASLSDLAFLTGLKSLRRLDLAWTDITDLTPLAGLPDLKYVNANATALQALPAAPLPGLRFLSVLDTQVPKEAAAAFGRAHVQCTVRRFPGPSVQAALAPATRMRVRAGAVSDPGEPEVLFEERDPVEVQRLIGGIRVEEESWGGACFCEGMPTWEFYQGDRLLLAVAPHGAALEVPEEWPHRVVPQPESVVWMERWAGERWPLEPEQRAWREGLRERVGRRMAARYQELLPQACAVSPGEPSRDEDQVRRITAAVPDATERALLCLRLLGCHPGSWDAEAGLDGVVTRSLLPGIAPAALARAVAGAATDPRVAAGAARWLFEEKKWRELDPTTPAAALPVAAESGLRHPRPANRRRTIWALGQIGGEAAIRLLERFLAGDYAPATVTDEELEEFPPRAIPIPEIEREIHVGSSDRDHARSVLDRLRGPAGKADEK